MGQPSTLPTIERIVNAAVYGLNNRIIAGGNAIRYKTSGNTTVYNDAYYNDMKAAYRPSRSFEQMDRYPCCNVVDDEEFCETSSNIQLDQNQALLHNEFRLNITCFLKDTNNQGLAQNKILSDIQTYFGINYHIPDADGSKTCFNCYYQSCTKFGIESNVDSCGIEIVYIVWYRQQLTNPRISG